MRVLRIRSGARGRMLLSLRPSVPEVLARLAVRRVWQWRRELTGLAGLWLALRVAGRLSGGHGGLTVAVVCAVLLGVPATRRPIVGWFYAGRVRRSWARACRAAELVGWMARTPPVRAVRPVSAGVVLTVRLLPGQEPDDLRRAAGRLAATMRVRSISVVADPADVGRVRVLVVYRQTLDRLVSPAPLHEPSGGGVDVAGLVAGLDRLVVGVREDGDPWLLPLRGAHVLVAGATGAGKGSVLWSAIRALGPAVSAGVVQVWGVDPKRMELSFGGGMFARLAVDVEDIATLLEDAVGRMRGRAGRLAGNSRTHVPTVDEPLIVVVIDEIASLTAYVTDQGLKKRLAAALAVLLSQGRAPGVVVVGAVQDPRKEVLPLRDLFPVRVVLRMSEPTQVDLVLGSGARDRGAYADLIPVSLPGVGYVLTDGDPTPAKVRAAFVSDDDIRHLSATHQADAGHGDGDDGDGWPQ
ncbi:MAG: FtsK/SpoIIIE domain-containing protein [Frankia sp.]